MGFFLPKSALESNYEIPKGKSKFEGTPNVPLETFQIAESHFAVSQFAESILPNPKLPIPILPNILKN